MYIYTHLVLNKADNITNVLITSAKLYNSDKSVLLGEDTTINNTDITTYVYQNQNSGGYPVKITIKNSATGFANADAIKTYLEQNPSKLVIGLSAQDSNENSQIAFVTQNIDRIPSGEFQTPNQD